MTQKPLETIVDNLRDGVAQLEPETFQHVDELTRERVSNEEVRHGWFYTADGNVYFVDKKDGKETPKWAVTRREHNPVLAHLNDNVNNSSKQLVNKGDYHPDEQEAQAAIGAKNTLVTDLTKLRLCNDGNSEWSYLAISTKDGKIIDEKGKKYDANEEEAKVMTRTGFTQEYLKLLRYNGIMSTRAYVLSPEYVIEHAKERPVARASRVDYFDGNSDFDAYVRDVGSRISLRGVRLEKPAEGGAPPENGVVKSPDEISTAYQMLLNKPVDALAKMTNDIAAGLLSLVSKHYNKQTQ